MDATATELDLSWIDEHLAVGARLTERGIEELARRHIVRHVVDVRSEAQDDPHALRLHGLTLLHLPTHDHHAISPPLLEQGVSWVSERLRRGERVYIHCEHGIGRSVLLSMCTLVALGEEPLRALVRIKRARPCASPSPVQIEAFLAWLAPHCARPPSWDQLADVAYRGALCSEPEQPGGVVGTS